MNNEINIEKIEKNDDNEILPIKNNENEKKAIKRKKKKKIGKKKIIKRKIFEEEKSILKEISSKRNKNENPKKHDCLSKTDN